MLFVSQNVAIFQSYTNTIKHKQKSPYSMQFESQSIVNEAHFSNCNKCTFSVYYIILQLLNPCTVFLSKSESGQSKALSLRLIRNYLQQKNIVNHYAIKSSPSSSKIIAGRGRQEQITGLSNKSMR